MWTESRVRAWTSAAAVTTVVIGLTTIGIAVSTSFKEVAPVALTIIGGVVVAAGFVNGVVMAIGPGSRGDKVFGIAQLLAVAGFLIGIAFGESAQAMMRLTGSSACVLSTIGGVVWLVLVLSERGASRQTCPDCAEQIMREAKVCRYCGHRFGSAGG